MFSRLCGRVVRSLYGELPHDKLVKAGTFSSLLCFVVGIYWLLRSLKDSVFATLVGLEYQPKAKIYSLGVVTCVLFVYNKVVDLVPRHQLFLIVCGTYSCIFVGTALCLLSPTIGLYGPDGKALPASPDRWLGWVHYFAIESYGSLAVSLFWQYTNSQVNLDEAKAQYGIITAGGQIGAIAGCSLVVGSNWFGVPQLYAAGGLLTLVPPAIVWFHHRRVVSEEALALSAGGEDGSGTRNPIDGRAVARARRKKSVVAPGLFEGLRLLLNHPYVLGIFAVSALFEVIATILDYQMKVLGKARHHSTADFAAFMGFFGQAANSVSLVFSLLGTSFIVRTFGLRITLMLFPALLIIAVRVVYAAPSMWVLFGVMVSIKGLAYALNNPSKEMLYMATTDSIKFKAKAWVDVFGGRASKAVGSLVTDSFKKPVENLIFYGSVVSVSIAATLLVIAAALGAAFERLMATHTVVGADDEHGAEATEMSALTGAELAWPPSDAEETGGRTGHEEASSTPPLRKSGGG